MDRNELHIIADNREQKPYLFDGASIYEGTTVEAGSLSVGDYSVKGLEHLVSVERKSLSDLVGCLAGSRERFVRELERSRALESFCVIVEGSWQELAQGQYRSQLRPQAACQSVAAFMARMRVPFWFCGSRPAAEYCCWSFLRQYTQGRLQELKTVERALGSPAGACARGMDNHKAGEPRDVLDAFGAPAEAYPDGMEDRR